MPLPHVASQWSGKRAACLGVCFVALHVFSLGHSAVTSAPLTPVAFLWLQDGLALAWQRQLPTLFLHQAGEHFPHGEIQEAGDLS